MVNPGLSRARWHAGDSPWLTNAALLLFGCIFIALTQSGTQEYDHYIHGISETIFGQFMLYFGAIGLVERSAINRWTLPLLLLLALAARLVAVAHPPFLSDDIYRYVWDGRVQNAGINPFRYIPADAHLAFLRDKYVYPLINRKEYAHTIYPPGSQFFFLVVARIHATVWFMKLAMVICEAVTCFVLIRCLDLLRLPRERVVLYAWHPIGVWEIASSGHVDAVAITALSLALLATLRRRPFAPAGWVAAATLIKLYPAALLPAFVRRRFVLPVLLFLGIVGAGYLPYLSVGSGVLGFLPSYAKEEGIESGVRFFPLAFLERHVHLTLQPSVYIVLCALAMAALAFWAWTYAQASGFRALQASLVLACALNLCFSPHYPWYFLWLLPFIVLWPWRPAAYMVLAPTFLLSTLLGVPGEGIYQMNVRLYGGFFALLAAEWLLSFRRERVDAAARQPAPESQQAHALAEMS